VNKFFELIQQHTENRPIILDQLVDDDRRITITCPYCESNDLNYRGCSCTLIGTIGGKDPNHYWCHAECNKCRRNIFYQHKLIYQNKTNVWFTDEAQHDKRGIVEKGIHNCCGGKYLHKKCGGIIYQLNTKLDGETLTTVLSYSYDKGKEFRTFIKCDKCELREEFE